MGGGALPCRARGGRDRAEPGHLADVAALRGRFDAAVLLPNSFATALVVRLAGIAERWGYATDGRSLLLTRSCRVPDDVRGRSQVYYYRAMLEGLGLATEGAPDATLACPEAWAAEGAALLGDDGPWIGVNPGAAYGTAKRWLPERFAAAADLVARRLGAKVAIVGGAAERPIGEAVAARLQAPSRLLAGETTLAGLVGVLARLRLLLTNDSGPHAPRGRARDAARRGLRIHRLDGDRARRARRRVVREAVECAPCMLRECPIDHRCMTRVSADRVADAALSLVGGH